MSTYKTRPARFFLLFLTFLSVTALADDSRITTLSLRTISGATYTLDNGTTPTYMKFWATWCKQCRAEGPDVQTIFDSASGKINVVTVNIGFDDTLQAVREYLDSYGYEYPVVFDENGDLGQIFDVFGTPTHFLFDPSGQLCRKEFALNNSFKSSIDNIMETGRCVAQE